MFSDHHRFHGGNVRERASLSTSPTYRRTSLTPPFKTRSIHLELVVKILVPLNPGSVLSAVQPAVIDSVYGHRLQTYVFTDNHLS